MFFFCLQCSMLWSCSASKISTELCRGCLTWSQIKTKKSTKSTIFTLVSFLIDCLGVAEKREKKTCLLISLFVLRFVRRSVLPSSSPRWQKNQMDIKMYLSGVVQVCSLLHVSLCFSPLRFQACVFLWGRYMKYRIQGFIFVNICFKIISCFPTAAVIQPNRGYGHLRGPEAHQPARTVLLVSTQTVSPPD